VASPPPSSSLIFFPKPTSATSSTRLSSASFPRAPSGAPSGAPPGSDLSPQRAVQRVLRVAAVRRGPRRARYPDLPRDGLPRQRHGRAAATNAAVSAMAPGLSSSSLTSFPAPSPAQPLLGVLPPRPARRCARAELSPQRAVQRILRVAAFRRRPCRASHLDLLSDGLPGQRRGRGGGHERGRDATVRVAH
jgi:hypothetical protein